jgi:hypothetical protein
MNTTRLVSYLGRDEQKKDKQNLSACPILPIICYQEIIS